MKNTLFSQIICFSCLGVLAFGVSTAHSEDEVAKPRLGPGALITIPADIDYASTHNRADLVEVLASLPDPPPELADDVRFNKEFWAKEIRYKRPIWGLRFSFKPVRIVYVDLLNPEDGKLNKKAVWYLVYSVKNPGPANLEKTTKERVITTDSGERKVVKVEFSNDNPGGTVSSGVETKKETPIAHDTVSVSEVAGTKIPQTRDGELVLRNAPGTFEPQPGSDEPIKFIPQFLLTADDVVDATASANNPLTGKVETQMELVSISYVDQIIPLALPAIMKREGMTVQPETTVSFPRKSIPSGEELWGVAMWTDIDPRIHRFSVYVTGLTNAYQWTDDGKNTGKPGEGRSIKRKILKTNWWRVGDQYSVSDSQIQYGFPGAVDFEWLFL